VGAKSACVTLEACLRHDGAGQALPGPLDRAGEDGEGFNVFAAMEDFD